MDAVGQIVFAKLHTNSFLTFFVKFLEPWVTIWYFEVNCTTTLLSQFKEILVINM